MMKHFQAAWTIDPVAKHVQIRRLVADVFAEFGEDAAVEVRPQAVIVIVRLPPFSVEGDGYLVATGQRVSRVVTGALRG